MTTTVEPFFESLTARELEVLRLMGQGCSNRDIAEKLVLSLSTVRWYLRQIYDKLDVHGRTEAVIHANQLGLLSETAQHASSRRSTPKTNLPLPPNPLLGRDIEVTELKDHLQQTRLVTLTGAAGVGKTRLAIEVAAQVSDKYPDGVFFVDLAPLTQPDLVPDIIAKVLGIPETEKETALEGLQQFLQNRHVLLVLDNFEHLVSSASILGVLLSSTFHVQLLATSREALRIYGEYEYAVQPLALPETGSPNTANVLGDYSATALFMQRAKSSKRDFEVDDETAPIIAEICRTLDGLPLAIELAAARVKLFSPQMLLDRLQSRLKTLTAGVRDAPQRHQTLRDALDWSYDLLTGDEKKLFWRLSVFVGGRSLDAVESICGIGLDMDVLDGLDSLLNKNLLKVVNESATQNPRFIMLETIQEYAHEKLDQSDESPALYSRHAEWFVSLAERAQSELRGQNQKFWFDTLTVEEGNFRAILNRAHHHLIDPVLGLRLAVSLSYFWGMRSPREGDAWLNQMLDITQGADPTLRAKALCGAGGNAYHRGDFDRTALLCDQALELSRQIGDKQVSAQALHLLAHVAQHRGDHSQGRALLSESLALSREIGDLLGSSKALNCLGDSCRFGQEYEQGRALMEEALSIIRELQDLHALANILTNLGMLLQRLEAYDQAKMYLQEAVDLGIQLHSEFILAYSIIGLAGLSVARGHPQEAALLIGVGEGMHSRIGTSLTPTERIDYELYVAAAHDQLDAITFTELQKNGQAMSFEEAINYIKYKIMDFE